MTGPRCLPEHLREREKGKKGRTAPATIGQLRLHAGVHGMASRNRCKSPSLATTTASASAHLPYYKKNHFVALLGSFTPVWIYFLYSISSFTKKKFVTSFFRHRCGAQKVDHALTFELGIVFGRTGGRDLSSQPRVLSSAREGSRWKQPTKREGKQHDA